MSNEASLRDGDIVSTATTIIVHGQDELNAALANATGGETIALAAADYDSIYLGNRAFDDTVTIVSADEGERAVFTGRINLANVSNLSFSGVDVVGDDPLAQYTPRVALYGSDHVSLGDMEISGVLPTTGVDPADPNATGREVMVGFAHEFGLVVRDSSQIDVDGVEITKTNVAVSLRGSEDVNLVNSEFHEIRADGVTIVGSQNILIENNYFHDFHPWRTPDGSAGDHPDFVQFFGAQGDGGVHGLTVRDNVMVQGDGGWTQSIFGHNSTGNSDGQAFTDFEISGNFIQNSHQHGITLGDVNGAQIFDNVLIPSGAEDALNLSVGRPTIDISNYRAEDGGSNIEIRDNVLTLRYGETYTPRSAREDAETHGVSVHDNEVLEVGGTIGAFWRELDLPETPASEGLADWVAEARAELLSAFGHDVASPEGGDPTDEHDQATVDQGLVGGDDDDALFGSDRDDLLDGRAGNDTLAGGAGNDTLIGGDGDDALTGGAGADRFAFDISSGQAQHDRITDLSFAEGDSLLLEGLEAADGPAPTSSGAVVGGVGDLLDLAGSGLATVSVADDVFTVTFAADHGSHRIDLAFASSDSSGLSQSLRDDAFSVLPGETTSLDVIANDSPASAVWLVDHGNSAIGAEISIAGGELRYAAPSANGEGLFLNDVVTYTVIGEDGVLGEASVEITLPNRGAPTHEGGDGSDSLSTGDSDDVVLGGDGGDTLYTRGGDDWLEAGGGDDRLVGGRGSDVMFGGDGADAFDFYGSDLAGSGQDVIADLSFAEGDRLVLRHFDEGAFTGEFDHLQATGATGKHANVRSFADLAELDELEGFAVTRSGETSLSLEMESSHGAGRVELMFGAEANAALDQFWDIA